MGATGLRLPARYAGMTAIAHGGMGDVVRATDDRLGRTVAIKVLAERYATNDEFRARFLRESQTAASLSNEPYVIAIYDVGESDGGLPFIVMEYLPGGTLADRLRDGPVDRRQALAWLAQAASALDAAHARGIVHRDVKPANLLVAEDGTIRVSDFGIARAATHDTLTAAGTVLGSTGYMAPEQARGEASTPASDRYALACVAFELLTGQRPFVRETHAAEAMAHANEAPPWPRAPSRRRCRPRSTSVLVAGLAKRPTIGRRAPATCRPSPGRAGGARDAPGRGIRSHRRRRRRGSCATARALGAASRSSRRPGSSWQGGPRVGAHLARRRRSDVDRRHDADAPG